jgi:hypothetical protein
MHYQQQDALGVAEDGAHAQMPEALAQPVQESQVGKQTLKQDQPRKRSELLVFEAQTRNTVGLAVNLGSAKLHFKRSPSRYNGCFRRRHFTPKSRPLSIFN